MRSIAARLAICAVIVTSAACGRSVSSEPVEPAEVEPPTGDVDEGEAAESAEAVDPEPALSPREHDRRGDEHLKAGRFERAISDFDVFLESEPEFEPHHWRRGIAYYYAGRHSDGAAQFELHRSVNPDDVENAVWHFLCKARASGVEAARAALLPVGPDPRTPMMTVYEMFAGRAAPAAVLREAAVARIPSEDALFYAHLYIGLLAEALGKMDEARHHIGLSATTHARPHYMGDIARMHAALLATDRETGR